MSTDQKPHEFRYSEAGAAYLLRPSVTDLRGQDFWKDGDRLEMLKEFTTLLQDAVELCQVCAFDSGNAEPYGRKVWFFAGPGTKYLNIRPNETQLYEAFMELGSQKKDKVVLSLDLYWNRLTKRWEGPAFLNVDDSPVRDYSKDGAPAVCMSALEAMLKAILEALK